MAPVFGNVVLLLVVVECECGLRAVPTCGGYPAKVIVTCMLEKVWCSWIFPLGSLGAPVLFGCAFLPGILAKGVLTLGNAYIAKAHRV